MPKNISVPPPIELLKEFLEYNPEDAKSLFGEFAYDGASNRAEIV